MRESPARGPLLEHYVAEVDGDAVRYHLRLERDGSGMLFANASTAVHLSSTGVAIARALLARSEDPDEVARGLVASFSHVTPSRAREDVSELQKVLEEMPRGRSGYPVSSLDDPRATVHRRTLSAPYCADVTAPSVGSLPTLLEKLFELSVPHVTFVLPPGTKPRHLVQLVERAEDLGLIAGVRGRASDLCAKGILIDLAQAGVDHVDLLYASADGSVHDSLLGVRDHTLARDLFERLLSLEVCPVAVVPLLASTLEELDELGEDLAAQRIDAVVAFALVAEGSEGQVLAPAALPQAATSISEVADHHNLNLIWAPPIERDERLSVAEQIKSGPRAVGEACVRVEPEGSVIAPTGQAVSAGNLNRHRWASIWQQKAFEHYREAVHAPDPCDACPGLGLCDGGCPMSRATWALSGGAR